MPHCSAYTFLPRGGVKKLNRFELIHTVSMIILSSKQMGLPNITPFDAKELVLRGESPVFIQRKFTDNSTMRFRILPGGILEQLENE